MTQNFKLEVHPSAVKGMDILMNDSSFTTSGINQAITTQTQIIEGVVRQKHYTLMGQVPSDFIPVIAGKGAYMTDIVKYVGAQTAKKQSSFVKPQNNIKKRSQTSVMFDKLGIENNFWEDEYQISDLLMRVADANYGQAFSLVEEFEAARFKKYQLDVQYTTFNGIDGGNSTGLINNADVLSEGVNTDLFPVALNVMTLAQIKVLCANIRTIFAERSKYTQMFNTWAMPTEEYLGINTPISDTYSTRSIRQVIEECFADIPGFKIVHSAYQNHTATAKARHVFYFKDPDTLAMFAPVPYTPYALYPFNGRDLTSIAEAQFTGVLVIRPREVLYADTQESTGSSS